MPSGALLGKYHAAGITCTGVAVFPHSAGSTDSLKNIAAATGGRFYEVKDPNTLPQIFVKEAQVVRRSLIVEEPVAPAVRYGLSEILRGLSDMPKLDGGDKSRA